MSVPTMDDLLKTFVETIDGAFCPDDFRRGLLAVLDRLKPVVADAFRAGGHVGFENDYATRIIDQIKGGEQ